MTKLPFQFPFLLTLQNPQPSIVCFFSYTFPIYLAQESLLKYVLPKKLKYCGSSHRGWWKKKLQKTPKKMLGKAVQTEMSNMNVLSLWRGEWGCLGSVTCCQVHVIKSPLVRDRAAFRAGWWVSPALLCQLKGVINALSLKCKRNPRMPHCWHQPDIVLCRGRAGIFLKEQWDIPLLQLLKWPWKATDSSCTGSPSPAWHGYFFLPSCGPCAEIGSCLRPGMGMLL